MKRVFDIVLSILLMAAFVVPFIVIAIIIKITSPGTILYWSDRVGRYNKIFRMPKMRSMRSGAPVVATHVLSNPGMYITPVGQFIRRTSLDELPQLWSIFRGDMSFVGPRPALYNQNDLIEMRTEHGVHRLLPGLTGLAQINGRDELAIPAKVALDVEYMQRQSFTFDLNILWHTIHKVLVSDGVSH